MLKKLFNFARENPILILIVLLGAGLRLVAIGEMPPSLNWDEVSHGYNAYSILKTGRDEWGESFPTIFRAYGDYKLPVYIYLTAISEFFLGLSEFSVRLPSVLAGIATVAFTYLLVNEILKNKKIALLSALLAAIEPWSLFLSRGAFEANLALFFIVSGIYFFFKGINSSRFFVPATFLLGLSVWTYNSARIFIPLLLVTLVFLFKDKLLEAYKNGKSFVRLSLILTALFLIPMFFQLLNPVGQARYGEVAIIDDGAIAQIIESREKSSFGPQITRLIYNRPTYFLSHFVKNWISHFSPGFLFLEGGSHYQFSVPNNGLIYLVNLPFFVLGLIILLIKALKKDKTSALLLAWLILSPIPSSLTREAPHVLRSITILPIPMVVTSLGLLTIINLFQKKFKYVATMIYIIVAVVFLESYLNDYFVNYKKNYSWSWQYGYKQVFQFVKENYDDYDKIIITKKYGEPHEFILFYWPWNPKDFRSDLNIKRFYQSNWYWVDSFDKFYFVNDWSIPKEEWQDFVLESGDNFNCEQSNCLLITSPNNVPKGWNKIKAINFLNGEVAFEMYEN